MKVQRLGRIGWGLRATSSFAFWRAAISYGAGAWAGRAAISFELRRFVVNRASARAGRAALAFAFWRSVIVNRVIAWAARATISFATWSHAAIYRAGAWAHRAASFFALWRSFVVDRVNLWVARAITSFATWSSATIYRAGAWAHRAAPFFALWRSVIVDRVGAGTGRAALSFATRRSATAYGINALGHRAAAFLALRRSFIVDRISASAGRAALSFATWRSTTAYDVGAWAHRAGPSLALWRSVIVARISAGTGRAALSFATWRSATVYGASAWAHRAAPFLSLSRSVIVDRVSAGTGRAALSFATRRSAVVYGVSAWSHRATNSFTTGRSAIVHGFSAWAARATISVASWRSFLIYRVNAWAARGSISFAFWGFVSVYRITRWAHRAATYFATGRFITYDLSSQLGRAATSLPSYRYLSTSVTALAALVPLSLVLWQSFLTGPFFASNARLGVNAYRFVFADGDFAIAFGTTLLLGASMTLIAVPLGAVLAFVMVRTDVPGRLWLERLILLLFFLPAVVLAFGYVAALGPAGILTVTFRQWTGAAPWNLYSFPFLVAIAGLTHVPHAYLCVATDLRGRGSDAEEAACSAGANPWRTALDVSLPMATPAILFAAVLVFLLGFELFGLPLVLGDPQGLLVLSTYLYKLGNQPAASPYQLMAVVGVIIAAIALPLVFILRLLLNETQRPVAPRTRIMRSARLKLGGWRWPAFLAIALWLAATVLVPLVAIALRSLAESQGEGMGLPGALTVDHYRALLDHADVKRSIVNTLAIGLIGGAAAVVVYTSIAFAIHRWRSAWARAVGYVVMLPRAMPGLVAGLALLWAFLLFKPLAPLRETLVSVWLAYMLVWLAYGVQLVSGMFRRVDPQLEDVARTAGATDARVRFDVTMPMIRNGFLAAWALIFLIFVREYSTGIYLLAPGTEVIGSLLVSLWGKGAFDLVSALSVVNLVMIGAGLLFADRLGVRLHG